MRDLLKSIGRGLSAGWVWPALALLALPACSLDSSAFPPTQQLDRGPEPRSSAIMCDIPQPQGVHCASDEEEAAGIEMTQAAIGLMRSASSTVGLDYSPDALLACDGKPLATVFLGPYPDGYATCLNCETQFHAVYADANAACAAQCEDLINFSEGPFPLDESVADYCQKNAKVSTNFDKNTCFANACSLGGTLLPGFVDPRRAPDDLKWTDHIGTSAVGSTLTRDEETTGSSLSDFNAGAASHPGQWITHADAWIEFEAGENDLSHVLGVSPACDGCSDQDPTLLDIASSLNLNNDGKVWLFQKDQVQQGPDFDGSGGTYAAGERFAIWIRDQYDGTAAISFWRVSTPCVPGSCSTTLISFQNGPTLPYPLRVDASLREKNATLTNVTIMRVK